MKILDIIAYVAFAMALIVLPFLMFSWFTYIWKLSKQRRLEPRKPVAGIPIRMVLCFMMPVLVGICACMLSQLTAKDEVLKRINSLPRDCYVSVNGRAVQDSQEIISVLKRLHSVLPHHSEPTKTIKVEICDHPRQITLILARDSANPREYWIFYPKYAITARNEIGRIITPSFDTY